MKPVVIDTALRRVLQEAVARHLTGGGWATRPEASHYLEESCSVLLPSLAKRTKKHGPSDRGALSGLVGTDLVRNGE